MTLGPATINGNVLMPTSDKAKEDDGEERIFQKVEQGVAKNKGQGSYPHGRKPGSKQGTYASPE